MTTKSHNKIRLKTLGDPPFNPTTGYFIVLSKLIHLADDGGSLHMFQKMCVFFKAPMMKFYGKLYNLPF